MTLSTPLVAALMTGAASIATIHGRRRRVNRRLHVARSRSAITAPARVATAVASADLPIDADQFTTWWLGSLGLSAGFVLIAGPVGWVVVALVVAGPLGVLGLRSGRREHRRRAELVDFADAVASGVRGGASLPAALSAAHGTLVGPLAAELADLTRHIDHGLAVSEAFAPWAKDAEPDVRLVGRAISMLAKHGGRSAEALERTASVLRSREDLRRERSGSATQARSSAAVMAAAPVAFALVSAVADPRTLEFLVATPVGLGCLALGITLDLLGAHWMAATVRKAT